MNILHIAFLRLLVDNFKTCTTTSYQMLHALLIPSIQPTTFTSVVFFDARKKEISGVLS
jgi:hypothetical protein